MHEVYADGVWTRFGQIAKVARHVAATYPLRPRPTSAAEFGAELIDRHQALAGLDVPERPAVQATRPCATAPTPWMIPWGLPGGAHHLGRASRIGKDHRRIYPHSCPF